MTSQHATRPAGTGSPPPPRVRVPHFPRWRPFTWVILAFNLAMLIWVIAGANTGKNCGGLSGDALTECDAGNVGTGIGVGIIILIWALGDIILGVLWLVTKPHNRDCPACGNKVRKGVMQCQSCGYDYTAMTGHGPQDPGPVDPGPGPGPAGQGPANGPWTDWGPRPR